MADFDINRKPSRGKSRGSRSGGRRDSGRSSRRDSDRPDRRDSGRSNRRDSGRFSGRRERPEMTDVICDKCGKECQVPFKPTSSKPIYCSDCFEKTDDRSGSSRRGSSGPSSADLDVINEKLNKIMKALKID